MKRWSVTQYDNGFYPIVLLKSIHRHLWSEKTLNCKKIHNITAYLILGKSVDSRLPLIAEPFPEGEPAEPALKRLQLRNL